MNGRPSHTPDGKRPLGVDHDPGKGTILGLTACLVVCLAFAAGFAVALATDQEKPAPGTDTGEEVMLLVGFAVGAVIFAGWIVREVLKRRTTRRSYRVEGDTIVCRSGRDILWREPCRAYRHIHWHEETRSYVNKYGRQYYTVQVLTLDHPQPERCFEIYAHQVAANLNAVASRWARTLGLPIVRDEAGQTVTRSPDELDKPLVALEAEGRLAATANGFDPAPNGARWEHDGDAIRVRVRPSRFVAIFFAPLLVLGAAASAIEAGQIVEEGIPALIVFLGLALAIVVATAVFRQTVRVTRQEVIGTYSCLGLILWRRRLAADSVVRVMRMDWPFSDGVIVAASQHRLFLVFLNRKVALWLVDVLQNAILKESSEHQKPA